MKPTFYASLLVATLLSTTVLAQEAKEAPKAEAVKPAAAAPSSGGKDYVILKVGNEEIKNSEILETWKGFFPDGPIPDFATFDENIRQNVVRGIATERLIYGEAAKAGVEKSDEVKKRLAAQQKQIVMQVFMEQKAKSLVSDAQLKAAYDQKVAAAKNEEEVKARHILIAVPSPSENEKALATAKDIVEQLKKGADFDKLAKEKSDDKGSGAQGGDLGWFTKGKMVAAFADAAFKLKKGEISEPVKSDFGWHIIKVEDRRAAKVPSFEELKESLQAEVTRKAVQTYLEGLLKSADIKYYSADGSQKELSRSLSPAAAGAAGAAATPAEKK